MFITKALDNRNMDRGAILTAPFERIGVGNIGVDNAGVDIPGVDGVEILVIVGTEIDETGATDTMNGVRVEVINMLEDLR